MARPKGTKVAARRLEQILRSFEENPDVLQGGLIASDLDFDTLLELGGQTSDAAALVAALSGKLQRGRQGDHLFVHGLVHVPVWLRERLDPGDVPALLSAVFAGRQVDLGDG